MKDSERQPNRNGAPRLFKRQRVLLSLLRALGGEVGNLDFQKLLFLYSEELSGQGEEAPYVFVPYRYGAFSFTSYADRRKLVEWGLLKDVDRSWQLTEAGWEHPAVTESRQTVRFALEYRNLRGDELVAETYRRFPYYAIRSSIAEKVLGGDHVALGLIEEAKPNGAVPLATIGYEGLSLERYLNRLIGAGTNVLVDVRRNPISRKYGFSKRTLAQACNGVGIEYRHLPQLGISSEQRRGLHCQADYDALFAEYERSTLLTEHETVEEIATWVNRGERVSLTCYERLPQQCHRRCVAEAVERVLGGEIRVSHL